MTPEAFYKKLNDIIGEATPFKKDCGILCDDACCKGDGGMYLFPHEPVKSPDFTVEKSNFKVMGKNVPIMFCSGKCNRDLRPLSCRIFPLMPYVSVTGELETILDPRGNGMCPIVFSQNIDLIDKKFFNRVNYIGKIMMLNQETAEFIFELSRLCDEYSQKLF